MTRLRTLIVDDEEPARWRLRELVMRHADVEIVGECANGGDALTAIRTLRPDLLFLDIQMPEIDGFDVLAAMPVDALPFTIFVTAYDHYAVRAFDTHALDYVLKPFSDERFERALARARARRDAQHRDEWTSRVVALLREQATPAPEQPADATDALDPDASPSSSGAFASPPLSASAASVAAGAAGASSLSSSSSSNLNCLAVRSGGKVIVLDASEIDWIEAAGVYVQVHTGRQAYLHRMALTELESRLAHARFVRIHRSALVNLDRVRELAPHPHGEFTVVLKDGTSLRLSRRYRARLEACLGQSL